MTQFCYQVIDQEIPKMAQMTPREQLTTIAGLHHLVHSPDMFDKVEKIVQRIDPSLELQTRIVEEIDVEDSLYPPGDHVKVLVKRS